MAAFDIVVVGGGINGAGVAQAACAKGYRVLLLEQQGIASATSGRSSKLIHGGLRYLESGHFGLVRESLRERALLLKRAPDLVRLVPFHIPVYAGTSRPAWKLRAGLALYALLGGFRRGAGFGSVPRDRWHRLDGLRTDGLRAVLRYADAQTDDAALCRAVMRSAIALGAELVCPGVFTGAAVTGVGCEVGYLDDGVPRTCTCHVLVNAAGPWAPAVIRRITPHADVPPFDLVQGTHVIVDAAMDACYYVESPADRRAVFVLPWQGRAMIGTTETLYRGDPGEVVPLPAEQDYLLDVFRHYFPGRGARPLDAFAGLRVLPAGPRRAFHRSRETLFALDNPRAPRAISILGGKLSVYRATAGKVLRAVRDSLPEPRTDIDTADLMLRPD